MALIKHSEKNLCQSLKTRRFYPSRQPLVLTIGNFDGMHRGHCAVLKRAQALAGQEGQVVVLTFSNHPSEVLRPEQRTRLLMHLASQTSSIAAVWH